jgi:hypothetical protein
MGLFYDQIKNSNFLCPFGSPSETQNLKVIFGVQNAYILMIHLNHWTTLIQV